MTSAFDTLSCQGFHNKTSLLFPKASDLDSKEIASNPILHIPKFRNHSESNKTDEVTHGFTSDDKSVNHKLDINIVSKFPYYPFLYNKNYMTETQETNQALVRDAEMVKNEQVSNSNETSQLLRDILQHKDKHLQERLGDNNNISDICGKHQENSDVGNQPKSVNDIMENSYHSDNDQVSVTSAELSADESEFSSSGENTNRERKSIHAMEDDYDIENCDENDMYDLEDSKEAKRARVDNILTNMRQQPSFVDPSNGNSMEVRKPKRKQYQPKWLEHTESKHRKLEKRALQEQLIQLQQQLHLVQKRYIELYDEEQMCNNSEESGKANMECNGDENDHDASVTRRKEQDYKMLPNSDEPTGEGRHIITNGNGLTKLNSSSESESTVKPDGVNGPLQQMDVQNLTKSLKSQLVDVVTNTVDNVLDKYMKEGSVKCLEKEKEKEKKKKSEGVKEVKEKLDIKPFEKPISVIRSSPNKEPFHDHIGNMARVLENTSSAFETPRGFTPDFHRTHTHHPLPFHLPFSYFPPTPIIHPPSLYSVAPLGVSEPEQTEALPLVVNQTPKKKRTKVTDTRLSPRAARALLGHDPMSLGQHGEHDRHPITSYPALIPPVLPTSVAIPNPSLQHSNVLDFYTREYNIGDPRSANHSPMHEQHLSPSTINSNSPDGFHMKSSDMMENNSDGFDGHLHMTSTLTPMHLRKAKLMFFYVRYPSSAILKIYFPDVKFNKNNTAQLVKWFSNFREFYYIQMEKYARQALAEGCKHPDDLVVTTDSELYRVLNLHYNRNNQIDVPENFRLVIQATLREFYKSVAAVKDQEPSWKKSIYKVIARMDDVLPEYFKSPNWMDQLGDM